MRWCPAVRLVVPAALLLAACDPGFEAEKQIDPAIYTSAIARTRTGVLDAFTGTSSCSCDRFECTGDRAAFSVVLPLNFESYWQTDGVFRPGVFRVRGDVPRAEARIEHNAEPFRAVKGEISIEESSATGVGITFDLLLLNETSGSFATMAGAIDAATCP